MLRVLAAAVALAALAAIVSAGEIGYSLYECDTGDVGMAYKFSDNCISYPEEKWDYVCDSWDHTTTLGIWDWTTNNDQPWTTWRFSSSMDSTTTLMDSTTTYNPIYYSSTTRPNPTTTSGAWTYYFNTAYSYTSNTFFAGDVWCPDADVYTQVYAGDAYAFEVIPGPNGFSKKLSEKEYCGYNSGNQKWFRYTHEGNGAVLEATTCGILEGDSVVAVYEENNGLCNTCAGYNDDWCGLGSSARFAAENGKSYFIVVTAYGGASTVSGELYIGEDAVFSSFSSTYSDWWWGWSSTWQNWWNCHWYPTGEVEYYGQEMSCTPLSGDSMNVSVGYFYTGAEPSTCDAATEDGWEYTFELNEDYYSYSMCSGSSTWWNYGFEYSCITEGGHPEGVQNGMIAFEMWGGDSCSAPASMEVATYYFDPTVDVWGWYGHESNKEQEGCQWFAGDFAELGLPNPGTPGESVNVWAYYTTNNWSWTTWNWNWSEGSWTTWQWPETTTFDWSSYGPWTTWNWNWSGYSSWKWDWAQTTTWPASWTTWNDYWTTVGRQSWPETTTWQPWPETTTWDMPWTTIDWAQTTTWDWDRTTTWDWDWQSNFWTTQSWYNNPNNWYGYYMYVDCADNEVRWYWSYGDCGNNNNVAMRASLSQVSGCVPSYVWGMGSAGDEEGVGQQTSIKMYCVGSAQDSGRTTNKGFTTNPEWTTNPAAFTRDTWADFSGASHAAASAALVAAAAVVAAVF